MEKNVCLKRQTAANVNIEAVKKGLKNIKDEKTLPNKSNFKGKRNKRERS